MPAVQQRQLLQSPLNQQEATGAIASVWAVRRVETPPAASAAAKTASRVRAARKRPCQHLAPWLTIRSPLLKSRQNGRKCPVFLAQQQHRHLPLLTHLI